MNYSILDGADKMDLSEVMALLKQTYWADKRTPEQVRRSMDHSRCYGLRLDGCQTLVGFARVISDPATGEDFFYYCGLYKGQDAFWLVQITTLAEGASDSIAQFRQWLGSVQVAA